MGKKSRVLTIAGKKVQGKLLKDKTAAGFVERDEARYVKRGKKGANIIQFTDQTAEKQFLRQRQIEKTEKKQFRENMAKRETDRWEAWAIAQYGYVPKVHEGRGWNHKKGMSNNAVTAYAEDKVPLSRVTRSLLNQHGIELTVKEAKARLEMIGVCEYHHTSKYANRTDFYDLLELKREIESERSTEK